MMQSNEIKNENKAMVTPKYKLGESKEVLGRTLFRVVALRDFGDVKAGDIGGWVETEDNLAQDGGAWVETEDNLAQDGGAWVYDEAMVYDGARVYDDARIFDKAIVCGNSLVYGNSLVREYAMVYDNAEVAGKAGIAGNAKVYDNALVSGYSLVSGNASIYGAARIFDNGVVDSIAQVCGNAVVTKAVNTIHTDKYIITITDNYLKIGCQNHPIDVWEAFTDEQIADLEVGALDWWRVWKPIIFTIINAY
jgi:carbonic anhydrase/acetyltransferase-like protein (isoleucine patch superfamily)